MLFQAVKVTNNESPHFGREGKVNSLTYTKWNKPQKYVVRFSDGQSPKRAVFYSRELTLQ